MKYGHDSVMSSIRNMNKYIYFLFSCNIFTEQQQFTTKQFKYNQVALFKTFLYKYSNTSKSGQIKCMTNEQVLTASE